MIQDTLIRVENDDRDERSDCPHCQVDPVPETDPVPDAEVEVNVLASNEAELGIIS